MDDSSFTRMTKGGISKNRDRETVFSFTPDTRILTERGEVAIQNLQIGDMVETADKGLEPIVWIGSVTVKAARRNAPVVIPEGTFDNIREIKVSQNMRILMRGWQLELNFGYHEALVSLKNLSYFNALSVIRKGTVEYYHILLEEHEIIYADGMACESFLPTEESLDALGPEQQASIYRVFPELQTDAAFYGPAARRELAPFEARLLEPNST